jgi:hypothetical protein
LGTLSHSWQDFFAHAIHAERGWAVFSAGIIRTPSVPQDVWPSSFNPRAWIVGAIPRGLPTAIGSVFGADRIPIVSDAGFGLLEGEHPTFYEPVPLESPEGQARRNTAQSYTIHRYNDSLAKWLSVCSCWCPGSF